MENQILTTENLFAHYGDIDTIKNVNVSFPKNSITAIMGPSGCGKTTFLRCLNRMHELTPNAGSRGKIILHDEDLNKLEPIEVRRKIGMVFQRPNPFPTMTIYDNVIAGYKLNGIRKKRIEFDHIVEDSLKKAGLWEEVKNNLHKKGSFLSGGQQQRLCIARALAVNPEIILMDEPTSALDPIATKIIEELIVELKNTVTVIMVTHNLAQAGRVSDYTAFFYLGDLLEFGQTEKVFTNPKNEITEKFLTGKIG